jgi:hypothetical protein
MLKAILYVGLAVFGIGATFVSPFAGVITCLETYMMNPSALTLTDGGFRYQLFCSLALILSCLVYRPNGLRRVGNDVWVMRLLWLFVAIAALSSLWALVSSSVAIDAAYEVFKTVLLVGLLVRVISSEKQMSIVIIALIIGAWHAAFLHVFGVRWGYVYNQFGKSSGVLSDPQTGVMILFVPLLILCTMYGTRVQKILSWCALPFVLDSIVETFERTALVVLAVECSLLVIYLPKRVTLRLLPVTLAAVGLFVFRLTPPDYWDKMATILTPHQETSADQRFIVGHASRQIFMDYPFGVGYRNYMFVSPRYLPEDSLTTFVGQQARSPHNSFAEILCDTGVEGFIPWITAFGWAIVLLRRVRRHARSAQISALQAYAMAFELGLYGWAVGGLTQDYQEVDPAYWFVGFAVVLARLCQEKTRKFVSEDVKTSGQVSVLVQESGVAYPVVV